MTFNHSATTRRQPLIRSDSYTTLLDATWSELVKAYEKIDPLAVLPVLQHLVENELVAAKAQNYRFAARRLAKMRRLAVNSDHSQAVNTLVAQLRETHRRRPRLQQEFDRAGLP